MNREGLDEDTSGNERNRLFPVIIELTILLTSVHVSDISDITGFLSFVVFSIRCVLCGVSILLFFYGSRAIVKKPLIIFR